MTIDQHIATAESGLFTAAAMAGKGYAQEAQAQASIAIAHALVALVRQGHDSAQTLPVNGGVTR